MSNAVSIVGFYPESFEANIYTAKPFRMIGLIDLSIKYGYGEEKVTLPFFRSSGTNSGKIKGLWYPIVGIKIYTGRFVEFTDYINFVLTNTTRNGMAKKGWLVKSLFFDNRYLDDNKIRGFSSGTHYDSLLWIGETLRDLYEAGRFKEKKDLSSIKLNEIITSEEVYKGNEKSQIENFERLIYDIFNEAWKNYFENIIY